MARFLLLMMIISLLLIVISFVGMSFNINAKTYSVFYFILSLGACLLAASITLGLFFLI